MKKVISAVIAVCIITTAFIIGIPAGAASGFYATTELVKIKNHIESDAGMNEYATVQGACTDGEYAYFAVQQSSTVILKYSLKTWKAVDKKTVTGLGHANDMAYNSRENRIVAANNYSSNDIVTIIDPKTLEVIGTAEPKRKKTESEIKKEAKDKNIGEDEIEKYKRIKIYSIAYNEQKDQYIAGISGTYDFVILNADFEQVKRFGGTSTGYTRQGCDCDENYIYFSQSGGNNAIVVYDYDGKYVDILSMGHSYEVENLFHVGNSFYTTLHYYGNFVHRVGMSNATRIRFSVRYDPGEGYGDEMEQTSVHYGEDTTLRANTYKRTNYFFGGWRASRSSDGKYLGYRKFSDKTEWLKEKDVYQYFLYRDGASVAKTVRFGSVTMTAFWISEKYTLRYDPDGAEGWMPEATLNYYSEYIVPECGYTMTGYVFTGFTAYRDYDGKYYGYRKNKKKPEWLEAEDVYKKYEFQPGDTLSRLTYGGTVTLSPVFRFAYTYNDDDTALLEYIGYEDIIHIPNPSGRLNTVSTGAFRDNGIITELYIPTTVEHIESEAVSDLSVLKSVYFEENFPDHYALDSIVGCDTPSVYLTYGGRKFLLGYAGGSIDAQLLCFNAAALRSALK